MTHNYCALPLSHVHGSRKPVFVDPLLMKQMELYVQTEIWCEEWDGPTREGYLREVWGTIKPIWYPPVGAAEGFIVVVELEIDDDIYDFLLANAPEIAEHLLSGDSTLDDLVSFWRTKATTVKQHLLDEYGIDIPRAEIWDRCFQRFAADGSDTNFEATAKLYYRKLLQAGLPPDYFTLPDWLQRQDREPDVTNVRSILDAPLDSRNQFLLRSDYLIELAVADNVDRLATANGM